MSSTAQLFRRWLRRHVAAGSWTVYMDFGVPFTRRVVCVDVGLHPSLGWRFRHDPVQIEEPWNLSALTLCDCHRFENQVCDVCQGIDSVSSST